MVITLQSYHAVMLLLHQNDIKTLFQHNNDIIITLCVHWVLLWCQLGKTIKNHQCTPILQFYSPLWCSWLSSVRLDPVDHISHSGVRRWVVGVASTTGPGCCSNQVPHPILATDQRTSTVTKARCTLALLADTDVVVSLVVVDVVAVKVRSHYVRLRVRLRVRISLRVRTTVTF